jgi:hypothetical protein
MSETTENSQIQERDEGMYPIGVNNSWHGGIHYSPEVVKAIFPGNVVGGKIQKDYFTVRYLKEITVTEYNALLGDEKKLYAERGEGDNIVYELIDDDKPLECKYSAGYVLLEHRLKVPQDGNNEPTNFDFFTLYMHLRPFGELAARQEIADFELPFYLKWAQVKIKEIKTSIKYYPGDKDIKFYDSTKIIVKENDWFYPSFNRGSLLIATRQKRVGSVTDRVIGAAEVETYVPASYFAGKEIRFILQPKRGQTIPLYHPRIPSAFGENEKRYNLLGNIRAGITESYKIIYAKETVLRSSPQFNWRIVNNLIKIEVQDLDGNIVENKPEGVILDSVGKETIPGSYNLYKLTALYTELYSCEPRTQAQTSNDYKCVTKANFSLIRQQYYTSPQIGINTIRIDNHEYVVIRNGPAAMVPDRKEEVMVNGIRIDSDKIIVLPEYFFSRFTRASGATITVFILTKIAQLNIGQWINKIDLTSAERGSVPADYIKVRVYFPKSGEGYAEVLADARKFNIFEGKTVFRFNATNGILPVREERGIACRDKDGYITDVLNERDSFEINNVPATHGARAEISAISSYNNNKQAVRYIEYDKDKYTPEGEIAVNDDYYKEDTRERAVKVYTLDEAAINNNKTLPISCGQTLGKSGRFLNHEDYCHLEVFFEDNEFVKDLFDGTYTYNRYNISEDAVIWEIDSSTIANKTVFLPTWSYWEIVQGEKYSKLSIQQLRIYFDPEVALERISGPNGRDGYFRIIPQAVRAYIYNKSHPITFGGINDEEGLYRYAQLLAAIIEKNKDGEYKCDFVDEGWFGLTFTLEGLNVTEEARQLTFWIENKHLNRFVENNTRNNTAGNIQVYDGEGDPNKPVFKELDRKPENLPYAYRKLEEVPDMKDRIYYKFSAREQNRDYYVLKDGPNIDTINLLNFNEGFFKIDEAENDTEIYLTRERVNDLVKEEAACEDYATSFSPTVRENLRYSVCLFAMEWNKDLFRLCGGDCIECTKPYRGECEYYPQQMLRAGHDPRYAPMKTEAMGRADVWNEVRELRGRSEKKLWHIHPAKLEERLREIGATPAGTLKRVQDRVLALECLIKGTGKGIYGQGNSTETYCNHAAFLTVEAVDGNFWQFIGKTTGLYRGVEPPWNQHYVDDNMFRRELGNYKRRSSKLWCDILERQAENSDATGICRIEPEEAQEKANLGYVVVAAWENADNPYKSPHYATVRPTADAYVPIKGPLLANVGEHNGIYYAKNRTALGDKFGEEAKWYYNRNQKFRESYERWEELKLK